MPVFHIEYYDADTDRNDIQTNIYARTADEAAEEFYDMYGVFPDDIWDAE